MEKEYTRYNWQEYKELLEKFNYTEEQIATVKEIRETAEEITKDQFDFLVQTKIISRTRKLKKIRTMYVFDSKVWYLDHYSKAYCYCATFTDEE